MTRTDVRAKYTLASESRDDVCNNAHFCYPPSIDTSRRKGYPQQDTTAYNIQF
ncbi:predicted protein [Botrytis cinerea T4]|uniref:Uncharacterized protein n=1 Tax=Botryotinia fuckeliana (strain T4) TaxID=999810 RepID=G2XV77_BOTF4|nr:predicted protein [Botrytis cinerea T4]